MRHCAQARRMFGPYWDGETTLAEREWFDRHLGDCDGCRRDYDALARTLEVTASLPRVEPAADLAERALARARRAAPVSDRFKVAPPNWVPAAAAAALVLAALLVIPRFAEPPGQAPVVASDVAPSEPVLVSQPAGGTVPKVSDPVAQAPTSAIFSEGDVAMVPDSLFDHSDDVEFILDPVVVNRRGRAAVSRTPDPVEARQAIITF